MEIKNKSAYILTPDGEFVKVKIKGTVPSIGGTYSGQPSNKIPLSRYASIAACFILFFSFGGAAYAYYTPVASLVLKMDPSIELKINRWNKIIETLPLNDDGKTILDSVDLKNKSVNEGLNMILDEATKENLIKPEPENDKKISLDVNSDKALDLNINEFENKVKDKNLQLEVKYPETVTSNDTKDNNTKDTLTKPEENTDKNKSKNTDNQNNSNSKNNQNGNKANNKNLNNSEKSKSEKDTKNSMRPIEKKSPAKEKDKKKIIETKTKKSSDIRKNIYNKLKNNLKTKNKKTKQKHFLISS